MELSNLLLLVAAISSLLLLLILVWRSLSNREGNTVQRAADSLRQDFAKSIASLSADLTERVVKSDAELRQEISDRINAGYKDLQEGLQTAVGGLQASFENIRAKVDERLLQIGDQVQTKLDANLKEGFKHFEKVQEYLRQAESHLQNVGHLGTSINELSSVLKMPHLRGRFGETTLERILADFLPAQSFEVQKTEVEGRPDAFVILPNARLAIDSKFPRESILPLFESSDEASLRAARETLRKFIKEQANSIAKYIRPDEGTAEIALMFLPSETVYFEVLRDTELCEHLYKSRVFPVSPNTLAIALKAIALSYGYYEMAKNVRSTIEEIKKAQRHFGLFEKQFGEIGSRLDKASEAYRKAQTHLGSYKGRIGKLTGEELGAEIPGESRQEGFLPPSETEGSE